MAPGPPAKSSEVKAVSVQLSATALVKSDKDEYTSIIPWFPLLEFTNIPSIPESGLIDPDKSLIDSV